MPESQVIATKAVKPEGRAKSEIAKSDVTGESERGQPIAAKESPSPRIRRPRLIKHREQRDEIRLQHGRVDASTALLLSWELFLAHAPILLSTHAMIFVFGLGMGSLAGELWQDGQTGASLAAYAGSYLGQWFLHIGLVRICLGLVRGRPANFDSLLSGGPIFVKYVASTVLYTLLVLLGLIAFVLPGLYLAVRFWPYQFFIIDGNCDIVDSLRLAGRFTSGNSYQLVVLSILSAGVLMFGVLLFFVGIFVAMPLISLMTTITYMMLTRQVVQRPVPE